MAEIENREHFFDDPLLPKLYLQSWQRADGDHKGCVLITHGMAEHSDCYTHVGEALAEAGWLTFGWDLQGHGQSEGKRGFVRGFGEFSRDLKAVIQKIKEDESLPTDNFHLFGHSMGGLVILQTLCGEHSPQVQSAIFSNPALGLAIQVPKFKEMASQWINQLWPTLTLSNEINYDILSRDRKTVESYSKDPLRHTKVSAPLFLGMMEAMEWVPRHIDKLKTPVFFQISGDDRLINAQSSLDLFKKIEGKKTIKLYEQSYHEVYNDINKQEAIDDLINYLGEFES